MSTCYDADATALALLDYTAPSDYELTSDWAEAWSSSPLGDPAVDDEDFFDPIDEYGPQALAPRPTSGVAIAAAVLGALGVGALLSVAVLDFAGSPTPTQTVVVPAVAAPVPATPQAPAPSTAPAPAPTASPVHNAAPVPVVAAPRPVATTRRVVVSSSNGAPAADPGPASDAGPADTATPADPAPPAVAPSPHRSVTINIPPPPAPPFVPPKLLPPPPPPVSIQIPLPGPFKLPSQQP